MSGQFKIYGFEGLVDAEETFMYVIENMEEIPNEFRGVITVTVEYSEEDPELNKS